MARADYKYDPSYIEQIVEFMGCGYSITAFAGEIGVCAQTVHEWGRIKPEFAEALNRGRAKRALFWEGKLIKITNSGEGSAISAMFALKNVAPHEFADRIVHASDPDAPMRMVGDDTALARAVAFLLTSGARREAQPVPRVIEGIVDGRVASPVQTP